MVDNVITFAMQHITASVLPVLLVVIVNRRYRRSPRVQTIFVRHFVHVPMVVFVHLRTIK